ncbi:hypothetical protein C1645_735906 [Glomus cerebriforme]|uniref:Uncharacterized protein n=1 Tax=Glomus cerebriforme TaxID=658196 RepID=A0A397T816_9GLOM|nr:hypothetical protein C1645_735906 [Glomus cerebriforme]
MVCPFLELQSLVHSFTQTTAENNNGANTYDPYLVNSSSNYNNYATTLDQSSQPSYGSPPQQQQHSYSPPLPPQTNDSRTFSCEVPGYTIKLIVTPTNNVGMQNQQNQNLYHVNNLNNNLDNNLNNQSRQ